MSKNKEKKKDKKYVSQIVVKKGKHEQENQEGVFNFDEEVILGVNTPPQTKGSSPKQSTKRNKKNKKKSKKETKEVNKNIPKSVQQERQKAKRKRMRIFKIIKIIILIAIFIALLCVFLLSPVFDVKNIEVSGNEKLTVEQIISLSGIIKGENTFQFSAREAKEKIKENAYVQTVKVERKLPSGVQISIQERTPAFLMEYGNSYIYLDSQGYILEIATEKLELPMIQGIVTPEEKLVTGGRLEKEDLEKLNVVLEIIKSADANGILDQLTKMDISDEQDYKMILNDGQVTAHLGDCSIIGTRMLYVKAILEDNLGIAGEIFVNMDLNTENPFFRKKV